MRAGAHVVQLHPGPAGGVPHFGSCWASGGEAGGPWGANRRSEWGAWAHAAGVHHACAVAPAVQEDRCLRQLRPERWEVPHFEVDVGRAAALVVDAALRISAAAGGRRRRGASAAAR
uniref:Uncharacterized protein n=1 Tax=Alexandrium monilatum TaxID=311494 RepID=A0A7S4QX15_9DINO